MANVSKYPIPLSKKDKEIVTASYFKALRYCTKTVYNIYQDFSNYFPKEYLALINNTNDPNGTIIRFSKSQNSDDKNTIRYLRVKNYGKNLTKKDIADLSNAWVYLEKNQTPLQFLDLFFKFTIHILELSNYRIKQMYQELQLELDDEDDFDKDPDYNPSSDSEDYHEELEYESEISDNEEDEEDDVDGEDDDDDNSSDYVPSVESEDEYENTHRTIVIKKRPARKYYKTIH